MLISLTWLSPLGEPRAEDDKERKKFRSGQTSSPQWSAPSGASTPSAVDFAVDSRGSLALSDSLQGACFLPFFYFCDVSYVALLQEVALKTVLLGDSSSSNQVRHRTPLPFDHY